MGPLAATENHPNPPLRVSKRGPSPGLAELGQRCWTSQVFHRPARISMHVDDALCDKASGLTRICSVLVRFLRAQNNKGPSRSWGRLGPLDLGSALGQRAPGKLGNPAIVPPPPRKFPSVLISRNRQASRNRQGEMGRWPTVHGVVFGFWSARAAGLLLHQRQQHDADHQHHEASRRRGGE